MNRRIALGQIIGDRYQLIEKLGQGTFGTTFIAEDKRLPSHSRCVVKQLTPRVNIDSEIIRRFELEARILEQLGEHPQIPKLLAYIHENEEFYLVQELIKGHTLVREFADLPFSEEQVKRLVRDILKILIFVKEKNCIHRDIKPSNLMRRASDNKIVLIDFGAVKEKIKTEIINSQEEATITLGSPGYMPIEQMRGFPCFQSDLYAVGMLAIYGLTGISPSTLTDRDGQVNWINYLANDREYDRHFLDFLDNLVRFNCRDRYSSAAAALDYLDRVETSTVGDVTISSPGNNNPMQRFRKPSFLFLIILGALAIISIGLFSVWLFNLSRKAKFVEYQNQNYGIQVDRPEDWNVEKKDDVFEKGIVFKSPLENKDDRFQEKVSISIEDLSSQPKSLAEYSNAKIQDIKKDWQPEKLEESETNLASRPADRVIYSYKDGDQKFKRMQVWNLKNNKAYVVTYTAEEDKYNKFLNQAEKIINSFKIE